MPSSFKVKTTPSFERDVRKLINRDEKVHEQLVKSVDALREDPYNIDGKYNIKNLLM